VYKRQGVALLQSAPQFRATTQFLIFVTPHSQNGLNQFLKFEHEK
jgi:hypothetical protein